MPHHFSIVIYHPYYSASFFNPEEVVNMQDYVVEWPGNVVTTLVCVFTYSRVIFTLRKNNLQVGNSLAVHAQEERNRQELRVTLQFLAISAFFTLTWVGFRILPGFITSLGYPKAYAVFVVIQEFNSSVNSFIYLLYNKEIRQKYSELRGNVLQSQHWATATAKMGKRMRRESNHGPLHRKQRAKVLHHTPVAVLFHTEGA